MSLFECGDVCITQNSTMDGLEVELTSDLLNDEIIGPYYTIYIPCMDSDRIAHPHQLKKLPDPNIKTTWDECLWMPEALYEK